MYLIQRLSEKQIAKYRDRSQMAINGLQNILQESDQIAKLPNVGAKWKYIAVHMGLDQQNGNSFYNYFISLNNNILFLVRNGNHNNINEQLYNMHEKLGRPNKRYIIFFKGMNESTDTPTKFLEAEHHTVNFPVNALDSVEDVQRYIHSLIKLFEDGGTEFPKLPIKPSLQAPQVDKDKSRSRKRTIRLTESKLCNIVREAVMREIGLLSESQESQIFDQAAQRLRKGENPKNIFDTIGPLENDGRRIVCLYDKDNLLNQEGNLILGTWFDDISWFEDDGYRRVWVGNKCNILNQEGNLILDKMFNNIGPIENDGCRKVSLDYKDNLLNQECQIVSGTWFDYIDWLEEDGYRKVWLNNKCNLLQDGNLISDTWFDYIDDVLCDGLRTVRMNNKYNLLQDGNLISDTWFDDMTHLGTKGGILVSLNGKHYKFRVENGQIVDYRLRTNESRVRLTNILTEEVFRRFKRSLLQL